MPAKTSMGASGCINVSMGFLQIVSEDQVICTQLTVDDALKMVISAGMRLPPEVIEKLSADSAPVFQNGKE